jgi:hypothetical protein
LIVALPIQIDALQSALISALMALGVPANLVRWHGQFPGNRMQTATMDEGRDRHVD